MKNINKSIAMMIKIAKKLDDKNLFYHSDKLFKIAKNITSQVQSDLTQDFAQDPDGQKLYLGTINPNSEAQKQADLLTLQRFQLLNTNTPESFVQKLFEFAQRNNIGNLVQAFDAYANAGAAYNGTVINRDPILKELYMRVRNTPRPITDEELVQELKMLIDPQKEMMNQARETRKQMPAGQAYENFTQAIEKIKNFYEYNKIKGEIFYFELFDENDKNNLYKLLDEKMTSINNQKNEDSVDKYNEYYDLARTEPLTGLETLKTEITNNRYLTEPQKKVLIREIDNRLTSRK
jgi:hypothetical protein